jgi:hypothetical protein
MVVDLEEEDEDRLRRTTTRLTITMTSFFFLSKQNTAEQLALLIRASSVQF